MIEAVVFEMMSWREGFFSFAEGSVADVPTDAPVRTMSAPCNSMPTVPAVGLPPGDCTVTPLAAVRRAGLVTNCFT